MRDRFWYMYFELKFKELYWDAYLNRSQRIQGLLSGVCAFFTAGSIVSWNIWPQIPLVWAVIMILVQTVQVILPRLPYANYIAGLRYMLPALKNLNEEAVSVWRRIDILPDDDIIAYMDKLEKQYISLYNQFIGSVFFPIIRKFEKKAAADCKCYFQALYFPQEKETIDANR